MTTLQIDAASDAVAATRAPATFARETLRRAGSALDREQFPVRREGGSSQGNAPRAGGEDIEQLEIIFRVGLTLPIEIVASQNKKSPIHTVSQDRRTAVIVIIRPSIRYGYVA